MMSSNPADLRSNPRVSSSNRSFLDETYRECRVPRRRSTPTPISVLPMSILTRKILTQLYALLFYTFALSDFPRKWVAWRYIKKKKKNIARKMTRDFLILKQHISHFFANETLVDYCLLKCVVRFAQKRYIVDIFSWRRRGTKWWSTTIMWARERNYREWKPIRVFLARLSGEK